MSIVSWSSIFELKNPDLTQLPWKRLGIHFTQVNGLTAGWINFVYLINKSLGDKFMIRMWIEKTGTAWIISQLMISR